MESELANKRREIISQSSSFKAYIDAVLPAGKVRKLLDILVEQCDVYVFGGVIRNFLLGYPFHRDIDLVVYAKEKITLPIELLHGINIARNKFGGVKLSLPHITIDVWGLESTWGLLQTKGKATPYSLIRTVFFNFSAIVFDYKHQHFIYSDDFLRFYDSKTIDLVYGRNPYPTACVVNTCYYAQEYNFSIGKKLRTWISRQALGDDIETQQVRRYGEVKFKEPIVNAFVEMCKIIKKPNTSVCIYDSDQRKYIFKFE